MSAKNLILLVIAAVIGAVAWQTIVRKTTPPPRSAAPPANAEFIDLSITPDLIMAEYLGAKPNQRDAVASDYIGAWIPDPGWTGDVEGAADMAGTRAVSLFYYKSTLTGGGFYVYCEVVTPPEFKKGDHVRATGQIAAIEVLPGRTIPIYRIVLDPATVTLDQPK